MHHSRILKSGRMLAAGLLLAGCFTMQSEARTPPRLRQGMTLFEEGLNRWDQEQLKQALDLFDKAVEQKPDQYKAWFMKGLTEFHLMLLHRSRGADADKTLSADLRDAAEHSMDRVLSLNRDFGEACALKAVLLGMAIAEHPLTAIWRGPRLQKLQKRALELDPENPRIWYLMGVSYHLAAGRFGSEVKALEYLTRADELFERDEPGRRAFHYPAWGHAHCLMFLGEIHREQNDKKEAERFYRKALAVNPYLDGVRKLLKEVRE